MKKSGVSKPDRHGVVRRGFRKSVWSRDTTGLTPMEGYLKKQSRRGVWQRRFFRTNNAYLNYYKSEKTDKVLASIDLREVGDAPELRGRFGEFVLIIDEESGDSKTDYGDGREFCLKAENVTAAQVWIKAIETRRQHYFDKDDMYDSPGTKLLSSKKMDTWASRNGWLQKKSPSRIKGWQDRYFKLVRSSLYYFKSAAVAEHDASDYLGEIVITDDSTFVIKGKEARILNIGTRFRTYELRGTSSSEVSAWLQALEAVRQALVDAAQNEMKRLFSGESPRPGADIQLLSSPSSSPKGPPPVPAWIVKWDEQSDEEHLRKVTRALNDRFKGIAEGDLVGVATAATVIIEELDDMAKECLPSYKGEGSEMRTEAGRDARIDIFEFHLRFYHIRLVQEISLFFRTDVFAHLSMQDLVRLMDLIVAYNDKLDEVLSSPCGRLARADTSVCAYG